MIALNLHYWTSSPAWHPGLPPLPDVLHFPSTAPAPGFSPFPLLSPKCWCFLSFQALLFCPSFFYAISSIPKVFKYHLLLTSKHVPKFRHISPLDPFSLPTGYWTYPTLNSTQRHLLLPCSLSGLTAHHSSKLSGQKPGKCSQRLPLRQHSYPSDAKSGQSTS